MRTAILFLALACAFAGCTDSSAIITGQARPATTPDKVVIYLQPPAKKYEVIGLVSGSSKGKLGISRQTKTNVAIRVLKEKAAEIGANGVILQQQGMQSESSVGTTSGEWRRVRGWRYHLRRCQRHGDLRAVTCE